MLGIALNTLNQRFNENLLNQWIDFIITLLSKFHNLDSNCDYLWVHKK